MLVTPITNASFIYKFNFLIFATCTTIALLMRVLATPFGFALLVVDINPVSLGMRNAPTHFDDVLIATLLFTPGIRYGYIVLLCMQFAIMLLMNCFSATFDLTDPGASNHIQTSRSSMDHAIILTSNVFVAPFFYTSLTVGVNINVVISRMHAAPTSAIGVLVTPFKFTYL